jgi:LysM repeat protein
VKKIILLLIFYHYLVTNIAQAVIWEGESANFKIRWTKNDITATTYFGESIYSSKKVARKNFKKDFLSESHKNNPCEDQHNFSLLSVVGSIVSISDIERVKCKTMLNSSMDHNFIAIDLAKSAEAVKLTDLFFESDILAALLNDKFIKLALQNSQKPTNLVKLFDVLEFSEIAIEDCTYALPFNFLNQFAFHHVKAEQVAIRLNLKPTTRACESKKMQLGFYLPIPSSLKIALDRAQKQNSGFLMRDQHRIAANNTSMVKLSTKDPLPIDQESDEPKIECKYHTLISGDTLYSISRKYNINIKDIAKLNNLSSSDYGNLYIGQKLKISCEKIKPQSDEPKDIEKIILEAIDSAEKLQQEIKAKSPSEFERIAELELSYLMSLQKACDLINTHKKQNIFPTWLKRHKEKQLLEDNNDNWQVNSQAFWRLHDKYYPLSISDKIDWQAAENVKVGNCDFECSLDWLTQTTITYLKYHPTGKYVDQALKKVQAFADKYRTETSLTGKNLPRLFAVTHLTVGRTNHQNTDSVLSKIDRLRQLAKQ